MLSKPVDADEDEFLDTLDVNVGDAHKLESSLPKVASHRVDVSPTISLISPYRKASIAPQANPNRI